MTAQSITGKTAAARLVRGQKAGPGDSEAAPGRPRPGRHRGIRPGRRLSTDFRNLNLKSTDLQVGSEASQSESSRSRSPGPGEGMGH